MTTENDNREAAYTPALDVIRERAICGGRVLDERAAAPRTTASVYGAEFDRAIAALSSRPSPATDEARELEDLLAHARLLRLKFGAEYTDALVERIEALASRPSSTPTPAAIQVTGEKLEREAVDSSSLAPAADDHAALVAGLREHADRLQVGHREAKAVMRSAAAALEGQGQK